MGGFPQRILPGVFRSLVFESFVHTAQDQNQMDTPQKL